MSPDTRPPLCPVSRTRVLSRFAPALLFLAAGARPFGLPVLAAAPSTVSPGSASSGEGTAPALSVQSLWPADGAKAVAADAVLRIRFTRPPVIGQAGFVRVTNATSGAVVESIDAGRKTATKTIGGFPDFIYYPITIFGNEAEIPLSGLAYGNSYTVSIDADVFPGATGLPGAAGGRPPLRFSTRAAAPAPGATRLTVAADGAGDFCTVQGAIDFVPAGNTTPVTLFIKKGYYPEIIAFAEKNAVTLIGEDRKQTIIAYATNAKFNPGGGNPFAGPSPNPSAQKSGGHVYHRGVFLGHRVQDLAIANLTIRNTTPQGGSQAEAIILNGTTQARAILRNVDLYSFQDTLQINGQAYIADSYIEGDVDFMWGTGPCFFENCECRALRSDAYYTQIRNPRTNHGYVYAHCLFDGARGVVGNYLSRIDPGRFPGSEVVLVDCTIGPSVGSTAWRFDVTKEGPDIHFFEFASHDADGKPVDTHLRLPASRQLKQPEDAALIAQYSDPTFVLGYGWKPRLAPIFALTLPAAKSVNEAR